MHTTPAPLILSNPSDSQIIKESRQHLILLGIGWAALSFPASYAFFGGNAEEFSREFLQPRLVNYFGDLFAGEEALDIMSAVLYQGGSFVNGFFEGKVAMMTLSLNIDSIKRMIKHRHDRLALSKEVGAFFARHGLSFLATLGMFSMSFRVVNGPLIASSLILNYAGNYPGLHLALDEISHVVRANVKRHFTHKGRPEVLAIGQEFRILEERMDNFSAKDRQTAMAVLSERRDSHLALNANEMLDLAYAITVEARATHTRTAKIVGMCLLFSVALSGYTVYSFESAQEILHDAGDVVPELSGCLAGLTLVALGIFFASEVVREWHESTVPELTGGLMRAVTFMSTAIFFVASLVSFPGGGNAARLAFDEIVEDESVFDGLVWSAVVGTIAINLLSCVADFPDYVKTIFFAFSKPHDQPGMMLEPLLVDSGVRDKFTHERNIRNLAEFKKGFRKLGTKLGSMSSEQLDSLLRTAIERPEILGGGNEADVQVLNQYYQLRLQTKGDVTLREIRAEQLGNVSVSSQRPQSPVPSFIA